jgi:2-iminoacetate synthase ThiH
MGTLTKVEVTFEQAKQAAEKVRYYMDNNISVRGPKWVDETFNLAYILQEWRCPDIFDPSRNVDDFKEEYEFIKSASSYNWHMYEDPD